MLENHVKTPRTLERLRSGLTGPFLDSFAEWLRQGGYAPVIVRFHVRAAHGLGGWMQQERLEPP